MRHLMLACYLITLTGLIQAGADRAVVDINTGELYLYDAEGEEIGTIAAGKVKKNFTSMTIDGKAVKGLAIIAVDTAEGLVSVTLPGYGEPVWLETMAIEIWPGNALDCPKVAESKQQIEQSGMSIGFGSHCK